MAIIPLVVLSAIIFLVPAACNVVSISNSILSVGINTAHGGAISSLIDRNVPGHNLINCYDQGREVQQSYYGGPTPYRGAHWGGNPWPWNPISSGDDAGHHSRILALVHSATEIYVKSRPLQWALDDVPCNCTFETNITLDANGVFVRNRLVNFRADHTDYGAHQQELPAVYTIGTLYNLWTYEGSQPWTGGPLTQVNYPVPGPPWASFTASENWAAFTMPAAPYYGVGVLHNNISFFLGGFAGDRGQGGFDDPSTGYIAPVGVRDIVWNDEFVWCYHLAVGYLEDIRSYFGQRRSVQCSF
jgi:hypothetical protein